MLPVVPVLEEGTGAGDTGGDTFGERAGVGPATATWMRVQVGAGGREGHTQVLGLCPWKCQGGGMFPGPQPDLGAC